MPRPARSRVAAARNASATVPSVMEAVQKGRVTRSVSGTTVASIPRQARILSAARQRRDSAMNALQDITSTASNDSTIDAMEASPKEGTASDHEDSLDVEVGRRGATPASAAATPLLARGRAPSMSGLDIDDSIFDDLNTTIDTNLPGSALRSNETSTLSATHFKRRPRASSFLSRDGGTLRPSSRAGLNTPAFSSTFNIGTFKRRQREPSILGTAQKERAQRPQPQIDNGDGPDDGAEADDQAEGEGSEPEGESTPLRRSKRSQAKEANPRKRKSTENHEQRERSSPFAGTQVLQAASSEHASSDHLSQQPPSTPVRGGPEEIAPPMSSGSSSSEGEIWPPLQSLARMRIRKPMPVSRTTPVRDDVSDMSSPPSLTHSPNYDIGSSPPPPRAAKVTKKAPAKKEKAPTTAALAELLPRRRRRHNRRGESDAEDSDEEVDAAGLGNNDDELTHLDVRPRRRAANSLSGSKANTGAAEKAKSSKDKAEKTPTTSRRRSTRTYGRSSDKENANDDEDVDEAEGGEEDNTFEASALDGVTEDTSMMVARMGEELVTAAKKFKEVDRWELDFEEATQPSSPQDAR